MRGTGPAAAWIGCTALAWVGWECLRVLLIRGIILGLTQGPVFDFRGWEGGWVTEFLVPALLALILMLGALLAGRFSISGRIGGVLFGAGALAVCAWTGVVSLSGISQWIDGWVALPMFFAVPEPLSWWTAWGRWWFDLSVLGGIAMLLTTGPRTPVAMRALFAAGLAVVADSGWRALVVVTSGQAPLLTEGSLAWGGWLDGIWILSAGLGVLFVFVFANLPNREGPHRVAVLGILGVGGVWLGLQGALLFIAGSLQAMGFDGHLIFEMPLYEAELGWLRLGLLLAGGAAVGIGALRAEDG